MAAALKQLRSRVITSLNKIKTWTENTLTEETPAEECHVRLERLEKFYQDLESIENQIFNEYPEVDLIIVTVEDDYCNIKAKLLQMINKHVPKEPLASLPPLLNLMFENQRSFIMNSTINNDRTSIINDSLQLPRVSIEKFDGIYKNWPAFEDAYLSSIHNNSNISGVTKFKLLKRLLADGPLSLIKNMLETEANYEEAWMKLLGRYKKPKFILNSYISAFLDLPSITNARSTSIRALCDKSDEIVIGIRTMGEEAEYRDAWLIQILLRKLDTQTRQEWASETVDEDFPSIDKFFAFINKRCDGLDDGELLVGPSSSIKPFNNLNKKSSVRAMQLTTEPTSCQFCSKSGHELYRCIKFRYSPASQRHSAVMNLQICQNCLKSDHKTSDCPVQVNCRYCNSRHHSLIHIFPKNSSKQYHPKPSHEHKLPNFESKPGVNGNSFMNAGVPEAANNSSTTSNSHAQHSHCLLTQTKNYISFNSIKPRIATLPTAIVYVRDYSDKNQYANALLDSGSQCSFVTERLVQRLGLTRSRSSNTVSGLSNTKATTTRGVVSLNVFSRISPFNIRLNAFILPRILSISSTEQHLVLPDRLKSLELADPNTGKFREIDILFGSDVFFDLIKNDKILVENQTYAQSTVFGWILLVPPMSDLNNIKTCTTTVIENDVNSILQRFWEVEEPPNAKSMSRNDPAEEHFSSAVKRNDSGRYIVKLPFKKSATSLGHSKSSAVKRLMAMERRFLRDPELGNQYRAFMNEYLSMGHMQLFEHSVPDHLSYFLPHHAVIKAESSTTKLRVVFDGSCKTSSGISLNDILMVGPTLQDDLITIITRFRQHSVVFSADIAKMYRQVLVNPSDICYQQILWRQNPQDVINTYQLNTVTYGTSCAPFLAVRTLHQVAHDCQEDHPDTANIIKRDFYIDDLLSGCETVDQANCHFKNLTEILNSAGFQLRKWKSNNIEFLQALPHDLKDPSCMEFSDDMMTTKTLGIHWNPIHDTFGFIIKRSLTAPNITKRQILSEIARIFDPLGWLSPTIVYLKIILQRIWLTQLEWDDKIPDDLNGEWSNVKSELHFLESIQIPRHFQLSSKTEVQLHAFCDASERAYAAVVYMRVPTTNGEVKTSLIVAKSKVAPLKQISLPRLELCGSVLLSKLVKFVQNVFKEQIFRVYAWTDSEIVLAWLSDYPCKWKTFIANRTTAILEIIPRSNWGHVPSKQNPADCASRGITPSSLVSHSLWWNGPAWLMSDADQWPSTNNLSVEAPEKRIIATTATFPTTANNDDYVDPLSISIVDYLLNKYSSYYKVRRLVFCLLNMHPTIRKLDVVERTLYAERKIIQYVQKMAFENDINRLNKMKPLERQSPLLKLSPFVDNNGMLRVGGRIDNSSLSYDMRHPFILPKSSRLTTLIIEEYHIQNFHPGPTLLLSLLRQKFWILSGRNAVRAITSRCQRCIRYKKKIGQQLMGQLPASRVESCSRPFKKTGMDYAGPIYLRAKHGRGKCSITKGYICIFVCLATKGIHIELVSDLTTDAFIAALRRFCGRRGYPEMLMSDNGTNFVGAKRELEELHQLFNNELSKNLIFSFFSQRLIKFTFNPASAPHFGGLWEANVKSIKMHLKRATNDAVLTFEEMATLLIQIEAVLNSRPLCPISDDPEDLNPLTPAHFWLGEAPTTLPEPSLDEVPVSRLSRWQNLQHRFQGFWRRWSLEYLHHLQQRPKWLRVEPNLKVGDLVLIKDDNLPPAHWLLGRIIQLHPGSDQLVRVVSVKTKSGEFRRPITKLCRLPTQDQNLNSAAIQLRVNNTITYDENPAYD